MLSELTKFNKINYVCNVSKLADNSKFTSPTKYKWNETNFQSYCYIYKVLNVFIYMYLTNMKLINECLYNSPILCCYKY